MGHHHQAGPSLFLAEHDAAHREHIHQHHILHNKRQTASEISIDEVVTEVVATVSVVAQVNVDSNGSTIAVQTVPDNSTAANSTAATTTTDGSSPSTSTDVSYPSTTPIGTSPGTTDSSSLVSSTSLASSTSATPTPPQSFSSSSATTALTSSPLSSSTFASLVPNTNSTTIISTPTSSLSSFSNSSITSTILSSSTISLTPLLSAAASTSFSADDDSADSSTSFFYSPTFSASVATVTPGAGGIGGGSGTDPGSSSPSHTAGSGSGSGSGDGGSGSSAPSTPVVVGGVVGGVAGAAILIFLLMILIRWKKRHSSMLSLGSGEGPNSSDPARSLPAPPPMSGGMVERASRVFAVPAAFTNFNRFSSKTDRTVSSTEGSERGFYRVSGRKLPSVFQHGGDGYGGGLDNNTLSGSSFYRDSQGFYGGPGSPTSPGAMNMPTQRDSGIPVMRPSPARTPVTEHATFSTIPPPLNIPKRPDVLGRSHPSQDGSHASRFTEEV